MIITVTVMKTSLTGFRSITPALRAIDMPRQVDPHCKSYRKRPLFGHTAHHGRITVRTLPQGTIDPYATSPTLEFSTSARSRERESARSAKRWADRLMSRMQRELQLRTPEQAAIPPRSVDFAALCVLALPALRAGEVAALELDVH